MPPLALAPVLQLCLRVHAFSQPGELPGPIEASIFWRCQLGKGALQTLGRVGPSQVADSLNRLCSGEASAALAGSGQLLALGDPDMLQSDLGLLVASRPPAFLVSNFSDLFPLARPQRSCAC